MIKYTFDGPIAIKNAKDANPQIIGEALASIATAGHLKPKAVLEAARDEQSPLHRHFEWDDGLAAEAYRLDQARTLIRIIRVDDAETESGTAQAWLSITDRSGTSYVTHDTVKHSADLQAIVLKQARRDLTAFTDRYRELTDVCADVAEAERKVARRIAKIEMGATA
jgi:hypothetical protein